MEAEYTLSPETYKYAQYEVGYSSKPIYKSHY